MSYIKKIKLDRIGVKSSVSNQFLDRLFLDRRESAASQLKQQEIMQLFSAGKVIQRLSDISDIDFIKKHGNKFEEAGWIISDLKKSLKGNSELTEDQYLRRSQIKKSNKKVKDNDPTYGGARLIGNSNALARAKFNSRKRTIDFLTWKKGREAQHMIPASIAKKNKVLAGIIDSKRNAIMLPALWKTGIRKPVHRQPKHRDHVTYTKNVRTMVTSVQNALGVNALNKAQWGDVMDTLRLVNKLATYKYIDKIPYSEFKKAWNGVNVVQI